jgi:hypothetical protein
MIQNQGADSLQAFVGELSPPVRDCFLKAAAADWLPLAAGAEIVALGADKLFPHEHLRLQQLGKLLARETLTGVYKAF